MVKATTGKFSSLKVEISTDGGTVWISPCGLIDFKVNREAQVDEAEVPDCDDDDLPLYKEREVRAVDMSVSGTGVWSRESHQLMLDWFKNGTKYDCRIGYLNAAPGDTQYERGFAMLTTWNHERQKGKKILAELSLTFDGYPTATTAAP